MSSPPSLPPSQDFLPTDFPPPPIKPVSVSPPPPPKSSGSPVTFPSSPLPGSDPSISPPPPPKSSGRVYPQTPSSSSTSPGGLSTGVMVGIAIGGVAIFVVVLTLICFICKKKRRRDNEAPHFVPAPKGLGIHQRTFTYEELSRATNKFSEVNLLGEGGFGYVYKGIMTNGEEIAVKQLKAGSGQGEREFQAEVNIITRVHHKYLVSLLGYYAAGVQRLLVYEYVPNNNLEFHLHGKGRPTMEWSLRLKIAVGSAKGLSYLHENCNPKIIHRDIKAANILIDLNFEAKVADFGLAKIASDTNTHVSTRVMGTFGSLAPEYAASGKLIEKSDVYSFGVVLLELITGRRPVDTI